MGLVHHGNDGERSRKGLPPTQKQLDAAQKLHNILAQAGTWPELKARYKEAQLDKAICSTFIGDASKKIEEANARRLFLLSLNDLTVVPGALRQQLQSAADDTQRYAILSEHKKRKRRSAVSESSSSPHGRVITYWLDAIRQTAFDGFAAADNVLDERAAASFTLDDLKQALHSQTIADLDPQSAQAQVRHVVMRLSKKEGKHDALCALPLQAFADNSERGYHWGAAVKELPAFNRNLIGEEARIEGLGLFNVQALDGLLAQLSEERLERAEDVEQEPLPPKNDAWDDLDRAFKRLTDSDGEDTGVDLVGWLSLFEASKSAHWHLKYKKVSFTLVDAASVTGPTKNVADTYSHLLDDKASLNSDGLALLRTLARVEPTLPRPYVSAQEGVDLWNLQAYSGHMDTLKKGVREAYPLDPAQRDAIIALRGVEQRQLLAVNGPPGTGKTSLLRAVIASQWIQPLLGTESLPPPPVILASAATNQAVTNIISSFDETPGPSLFDASGQFIAATSEVGAESRWLPFLVSYGWYAPASKDAKFDRFQLIRRESPSDKWSIEGACAKFGQVSKKDLEQRFMQCAQGFLKSAKPLDEVVKGLLQTVRAEWKAIQDTSTAATKWFQALDELAEMPPWDPVAQSELLALQARTFALTNGTDGVNDLAKQIRDVQAVKKRLNEAVEFCRENSLVKLVEKLVKPAARSGDPLLLQFEFLKTRAENLAELLQEITRRLQAGLLQRLRDWAQQKFNPEKLKAEQEAMRAVLAACSVELGQTSQGLDLKQAHEAVELEYAPLVARLEGLAVQLMVTYLTPMEPGQIGPQRVEEGMSRLHARQQWADSAIGRLTAKREYTIGQCKKLGEKIEQLTQHRDAYELLMDRAVSARARLLSTLQREDKQDLRSGKLRDLLDSMVVGHDIQPTLQAHKSQLLKLLQDRFDTIERVRLFHFCARYWEGRYVQECLSQEKLLANNAAHRQSSAEELRHLAMLAPVFVATAASTPRVMRRFLGSLENGTPPYLFGEADLLIVDEAGQASPETNASSFAFAKRAIVVGDVDQLVPVWSTAEASDALLIERHELAKLVPAGVTVPLVMLNSTGLMASSGSIMRAAQNATHITVPGARQRGLTLINHYRCLAPIIDICNRMVYRGDLTCATRAPDAFWKGHLKRLAYLQVDDIPNTKQSGGSRANEPEARLIARWLRENRSSLMAHFAPEGGKTLADVVAVVTPYKAQEGKIKECIAREFGEPYGSEAPERGLLHTDMTIGTVHSLQGAEKEVVIFSLVDTNTPTERQFFDRRVDLINVAVSRAKHMLITTLTKAAVQHGLGLSDAMLDAANPPKPSDYLMQAMAQRGSRLNPQTVVLVESPNKCDKVHQALGGTLDIAVLATNGSIRQLADATKWDASEAQAPEWGEISVPGQVLMDKLVFLWAGLYELVVATDPDAEGETIAWHCLEVLAQRLVLAPKGQHSAIGPHVRRMRFNTLQADDIHKAWQDAGQGLDAGLVKSALARTFLDHLISNHLPVRLGIAATPGLQAGVGRVQLGILDLVSRQTLAKPSYEVNMRLKWAQGGESSAQVQLDAGAGPRPASYPSIEAAQTISSQLNNQLQRSPPALVLSTRTRLQQIGSLPVINTARFLALANRTKGYTPHQTMELLQKLYEGTAAADATVQEDTDG